MAVVSGSIKLFNSSFFFCSFLIPVSLKFFDSVISEQKEERRKEHRLRLVYIRICGVEET